MKINEVSLYENKSHRILAEGYQDLTENQKSCLNRFEQELWPLLEDVTHLFEQELTKDQILNIFKSAEDAAMASGDNRTALGKGVDKAAGAAKLGADAVKKLNNKINELGTLAKNTGPVKNADAKFNKLKSDIQKNNPDNKIVKSVQQVSDWAKDNPGKATLAVGILTAVASVLAGPGGGAAAGFLLRGTKDLLQGDDLSTATGKALKTAAIGALVGVVADQVGGFFQGAQGDIIDQGAFAKVDYGASKTLSSPGLEWTRTIRGVNITTTPEDASLINNLMSEIGQGGSIANKAFEELSDMADLIKSADYKETLQALGAEARSNDTLYQFITAAKKGITGLAQGAAAASNDKKESTEMAEKFDRYVAEGPMDALKKGAGAVGSALKKGAANLTNKATAQNLERMWNQSGSPTDAASIVNILTQAGLSDESIATVSKQSGIKLDKKAAGADDSTLKTIVDQIKKLGLTDTVKTALSKYA